MLKVCLHRKCYSHILQQLTLKGQIQYCPIFKPAVYTGLVRLTFHLCYTVNKRHKSIFTLQDFYFTCVTKVIVCWVQSASKMQLLCTQYSQSTVVAATAAAIAVLLLYHHHVHVYTDDSKDFWNLFQPEKHYSRLTTKY